jgi:hypothetical protein
VALSLVEPDFSFVTHDKNGAWRALREMWAPGERLLGVAPFLRRLQEAKGFARSRRPRRLDRVRRAETVVVGCLASHALFRF